MQIPSLLQNRSVQIGLGIVVIILLIAILSGGNVANDQVLRPTPEASRLPIVSLTEDKARQAADYRNLIQDRLPLYINDFQTSTPITTNISVTALPQDPPEVVYLSIGGVSYINPEVIDNPNATAFAESYRAAMNLLRDLGVDPTKLVFVYGDRDYVRLTADKWISSMNLKP